jgi:predicted metalloprotease
MKSIPTIEQPAKADPALEIKNNYTFFSDDKFPSLNSNIEYSKAVGDLARIQEKMLHDRNQARNYPEILIGNGRFTGKCDTGSASIGSYYYGNGCKSILINFSSDGIAYEYPIEVLTVLAHEYAHHLVNVTIGTNSVSDLDGELIADCFAGLVHGYWDRHGKVNEQEVVAAANMMIQVSTKDHMNTSAMHGVAGQRLGAFIGGALKATGKESVEYNNFCKSLDRVIDWNRGLP